VTGQPLAYSYIRFSSPEQAQGTSLHRQIDRARSYAAKHGLRLDDSLTFKDLGVSAYDQSNLGSGSALGQFLEQVKAGRVPRGSYLLIESLDRLSRATITVAFQLLLSLLNEGIVVVTLMDGGRYEQTNTSADFTQLLVSLSILQRANEESQTKADRVSQAWRKKRVGASVAKLTKLCPGWLELSPDRREFVPIAERVAVVQEIIKLTLQGIGRAKIAQELNQRGVKSIAHPRQSRRLQGSKANLEQAWHPSYIGKLLSNRALVGEFQPHRVDTQDGPTKGKRVPDGQPVANYFPALVTEEEFARLQDVIRESTSVGRGRKGAAFSNLFTGLLRCGHCEGSMVYVNKGNDTRGNRDNRRNRLLVCSRANRGLGCHKVPWVYHEFEDAFFAYASKTSFADFVTAATERDQEARMLRDKLAAFRQKLGRNQEQRERLVKAIGDDDSADLDDLRNRVRDLRREANETEALLASLEAELQRLARESEDGQAALDALTKVRSEVQQRTGDDAYAFRASVNRHLHRTVHRIVLFPGGVIFPTAIQEKTRAMLLKAGHDEPAASAAAARFARTSPDPSARFFVVQNRSGQLQVLNPASAVPDVLEHLELQMKAAITQWQLLQEQSTTSA